MQTLGLFVLFGCIAGASVVGLQVLNIKWGSNPKMDALIVVCGTVIAIAFLITYVILKSAEYKAQTARLRYGRQLDDQSNRTSGLTGSGGLIAIALAMVLVLAFQVDSGPIMQAPIALGLEVLGAFVLVLGELRVQASRIRIEREAGRDVKTNPIEWLPVLLAKYFGSRNPAKSQESVVESLTSRFWGLLLLGLGFFLQVYRLIQAS